MNVVSSNHPETISQTPSPWKNCLPRNWPLVPKRLGTAALNYWCSFTAKPKSLGIKQYTKLGDKVPITNLKIEARKTTAQARVAQFCIVPRTEKVKGSIPSQGTCLGYRFGPQSKHMQEANDGCFPLTSMILSLFLPPFPPL